MGLLRLEAMGITLEAPDNFHFYDDGEVMSLGAHSIKLRQKYRHINIPKLVESGCIKLLESVEPVYRRITDKTIPIRIPVGGNYYFHSGRYRDLEDTLEKGGEVHNHVYILEGQTPVVASMIKGHEETHTLSYLHSLDRLKEALGMMGVDSKTLDELPLEVICQIGGFFAMVRNNPAEKEYRLLGSPYNATMYDWLRKNSDWKGWGN